MVWRFGLFTKYIPTCLDYHKLYFHCDKIGQMCSHLSVILFTCLSVYFFAGWHLGAILNHSFAPHIVSPLLSNASFYWCMAVYDWPVVWITCFSQGDNVFIQFFSSYWFLKVLSPSTHRGHGGRVVTLSPPTSEAGVRFPARPQVGKLVVPSVGRQFTVQNPSELYVLVSSALPTTHCDMTCTVLKAT